MTCRALPMNPVIGIACFILAAGCSRVALKAPSFDPAEATQAALAELDANHDGVLENTELANCPSLLSAQAAIDEDGDGRITRAELVARLKSYRGLAGAVKLFSCRVLLNDQPLANASVTLEPEKFLGPTFTPAAGATTSQGDAVVSAADVKAKGFSGVYCGLYRVRISVKDPSGKERVPEKYNTATTLGVEVAADTEPGKSHVFRLSGRSSGR